MTSLQGHLWSHSGVQSAPQADSLLPVKENHEVEFWEDGKALREEGESVKTDRK